MPVCVRTYVNLSYGDAVSQQIAMRDQQSLRVGSLIQAIRGENETAFLRLFTAFQVSVWM